MKTNLRHETGDKLESVEIVTERSFECVRPDDCMCTTGPDCASCIMRCANPYAHSSLQSGTKSFEDWTGTPEGSMALTVVVRCDSFAAATGGLRAAFNAGSRHQVVNESTITHPSGVGPDASGVTHGKDSDEGVKGPSDQSAELIHRLRERARIRRQIPGRKSVEEGKPDRIADVLDEAAAEIERLRNALDDIRRQK